MNDVSKITADTTLVDILENNRGVDRAVTYVDGENSERRVAYGELEAAIERSADEVFGW